MKHLKTLYWSFFAEEDSDADPVITLSCGDSSDYNGKKDHCATCESFGQKSTTCTCDGDKCNGSGMLQFSLAAMSAAAIFKFLF